MKAHKSIELKQISNLDMYAIKKEKRVSEWESERERERDMSSLMMPFNTFHSIAALQSRKEKDRFCRPNVC